MLQIVGFILCAVLVSNGALIYTIANRDETFIKGWGRTVFTLCLISAGFFIVWLLSQGDAILQALPTQ